MKNRYILLTIILILLSSIGSVFAEEVIIEEVISTEELRVKILDQNDNVYNATVEYAIYTDQESIKKDIQPLDGMISISTSDIKKGETFTYLVITPMNQSYNSSLKVDLHDLDLTKSLILDDIKLEEASITPSETEALVDRIKSFNIKLTNNNEKLAGSKVFESEDSLIFYIPRNTKSTFDMTAYDLDGNVIDLEGESISIDFSDGFGEEPIYNAKTNELEVFSISGEYRDVFKGNIIIGEYNKKVVVMTYKGKLGFIKVQTPEASPVNKWISYSIKYRIDGVEKGSNSNGRAYNGELAIPIQNDFVNVEYAYTVISSEEAINDKYYANTKFLDLTDKILNNSNEFYDLGVAKLQVARVSVSVLDKEGNTWNKARVVNSINYSGDKYDFDNVSIATPLVDGKISLASLGESFSSEIDLHIEAFGDVNNYPIVETVDLNGNTEITLRSPDLKANIKGKLLIAIGESIPVGDGRDTFVRIRNITDNTNSIDMYSNSGEYSIRDLIEGKEYEINMYLDSGDFNDINITDSIPVRIVYSKTPGSFTTKDIEGNDVNYTVNSDGTVELDLVATKPIFKGQVYTGNIPASNGIVVSIYSLNGREVAKGQIHSVTTPNSNEVEQAAFLIGGIGAIEGTYTVVVEDPMDTIDYTGFSFTYDFTKESVNYKKIQLPESIIYGKLKVSVNDEGKYANNFRRIYINIFDEYGNYIRNAKVRADGVFAVGQLENGRYYAEAFVSPYSSLSTDYISSEREVFIVDNSQKTAFDLPLKKIIAEGLVVTQSNHRVAGVWVKILNNKYEEVVSVSTDQNGNFSIPELEDGTYLIKALGVSGLHDSFENELVVTNGAAHISSIKLELTNPLIEGSVFANEAKVANVDVLIFNSNMQFVSFESVNQNGDFALGGLKDGKYYVQAVPQVNIEGYTQTSFIEVTINSNEHISLDINLNVVEIKGKVLDPSKNLVATGWVHLYNEEKIIATAKVNKQGVFEFGNLEEGKVYTVMADASNTSYNPSSSLEVRKGDLEAELTLRDQASIVGVIEDSEGYINNQAIYLYDSAKTAVAVTYTNVFGEFSFIDLQVGEYSLVTLKANGEHSVINVNYLGQEIITQTITLN